MEPTQPETGNFSNTAVEILTLKLREPGVWAEAFQQIRDLNLELSKFAWSLVDFDLVQPELATHPHYGYSGQTSLLKQIV